MFKKKKELKLKKIEKAIQELEKQKQELLFIREQLTSSTPKVDISNLYVWKDKNLCSIVRLDIKKISGINWGGKGVEVDGYQSTLTDVFTNDIVYQKNSTLKIQRKEFISGDLLDGNSYALLLPIYDVTKDVLVYPDKKVPLFVLQQLYYNLNNIDVTKYVLTKGK